MIKSHKELIVWQFSYKLTVEMYRITALFPSNERFGISSQMRRAALSIASNIAEGYYRLSLKQYIHFLSIARGSAEELDTQLCISNELGYINQEDFNTTIERTTSISKMLFVLIKKLQGI